MEDSAQVKSPVENCPQAETGSNENGKEKESNFKQGESGYNLVFKGQNKPDRADTKRREELEKS
jgi:hypothetical protein